MSEGRRGETQEEVQDPETLEPTTLSDLLISFVSSPKWKRRIVIAFAVIGSLVVLCNFLGSASDIVANIFAILYEESRQPHLEYSYSLLFSEKDHQVYEDAVEQLTEDFLEGIHGYIQTRATTQPEAISAVRHMTTTIPVQTTSVKALVRNNGTATAETVRVFFALDRPISSYSVESPEPWEAKGGVGDSRITIEVDRMVEGDIVTITVTSEAAKVNTQMDTIVLEMPKSKLSPNLKYVPAQDWWVNVRVTSKEGPATRLAGSPTIQDLEDYSLLLVRKLTQLLSIETPGCAIVDSFPSEWTLLQRKEINIDQDFDTECLVVFVDDYAPQQGISPVGVAVYDFLPRRDSKSLTTRMPDWPEDQEVYLLSPDKNGTGFLSDRAGNLSEMIQVYDADGDTFDEIVFLGFSGYDFPTSLSIFEWEDQKTGYRLMTSPLAGGPVRGPLWSDAGIDIIRKALTYEEGNVIMGPIETVTVMTRPSQPSWYLRSHLCYAQIYGWNASKTVLEPHDYYLTFCFGRPRDSLPRRDEYITWYPEQALLAWYDEGEVREISIAAEDLNKKTVPATVTLRQVGQRSLTAHITLHERSGYQEHGVPIWAVEMVGVPFRP